MSSLLLNLKNGFSYHVGWTDAVGNKKESLRFALYYKNQEVDVSNRWDSITDKRNYIKYKPSNINSFSEKFENASDITNYEQDENVLVIGSNTIRNIDRKISIEVQLVTEYAEPYIQFAVFYKDTVFKYFENFEEAFKYAFLGDK